VKADEQALTQVVTNLLLNAVQAAQQNAIGRPGQGRVQIELAAEDGRAAELVISDSGAGPSTAVANKLFEPFVTDKTEGAGLGLAAAKDVVAAHGGTIKWTRENGMTQFRVILPLAENGCARVANTHS
jgi:nitrogen-specific signal transduction histidine kinase